MKRKNPLLEVHTHVIDRLAVANGIISGLALYPQVIVIARSMDLSGVSGMSFAIILLNNIIWTIYAFHRHLISLFIASLLNILAAAAVLFVLVRGSLLF